MRLAANGVTVDFGGPHGPALNDVTFDFGVGELVAIVGPNGSGKTTLMRAMLGLATLKRGTVTLDDRELAAWPRRALAEAIGALPQREEPAFPLTVREAVLMGRWARLGPIAAITREDHDAIAGALARCDVSGFEDRRIDTLSGGEWQRVRIARALAAMPRLLLLDEPTASLDLGHEMELFELLRHFADTELGVLIVTHHLDLAARFADRLLLLDRGRAIAHGTATDVLLPDLLSRVFAWPVAVTRSDEWGMQVVPIRKPGIHNQGEANDAVED